ncbi:hypothetical protein [Pseudoxanthomonas sp. J35]|uniref:hypothetical protein n=1 Tax=Pseudoxanthomonas sp. J35 TaxID=935852 RepID=UPI0012EB2F73|nr:hypothetical protein [Pseudoxanthomonas sp. J35]
MTTTSSGDQRAREADFATPGADVRGERPWRIETTQRLHTLQRAIRDGQMRFPESLAGVVDEIMAISLQPGQLINRNALSPEAFGMVRTAAMALTYDAERCAGEGDSRAPIKLADAQVELFRHFSEVFVAVAGRPYHAFATIDDLATAVRKRARGSSATLARNYENACNGLAGFYQAHARTLWNYARELGGLKLVLGGQRQFGSSAFSGLRRMALYADTQLVADPVYPFFERDLDLGAEHVELLRQLYQLLQLTPLVEAGLPVPPVLVFPSFEKGLEDLDVYTQVGIGDLVLQAVGAACDATFSELDELQAFVRENPERFVTDVMRAQLFLPPGVVPGEIMDPRVAVKRYLDEIAEYRRPESVRALAEAPLPRVLLTGIAERFAPQYHLLENASELSAQPMLTQRTHWHFFERASAASAVDLHRQDILSEGGLKALQALQHARLAWLGDIPMPVLVELLANQENLAFRRQLGEHTRALSLAGPAELDRVVREVCHAINAMAQSHDKTIGEIDAKYAPKYAATQWTGAAGIGLGFGAMLLPMLSAFGPAPPLAAGVAMLGKLGVDKLHENAERRRARSSLMGVLAAVSRQ